MELKTKMRVHLEGLHQQLMESEATAAQQQNALQVRETRRKGGP
jgi:hypothetical protein